MKQLWDADELGEHWSLTFEELELLKTKPEKNYLGFCIQLKYYQFYGSFPKEKHEFADTPLQYIVEQLEIDYSSYWEYEWQGRSAQRHRQEILEYLGIRKSSTDDKAKLTVWLCETVFPNGNTVKESLEYVYEWLHSNKIDRPTEKQLEREIAAAYNEFESKLFEVFSKYIPLSSINLIDDCLEDNSEVDINFSLLKSDPGRISLDSVLKEIAKLDFINSLELLDSQLSTVNSKIIDRLRQRILSETAWEVRRHPVTIRYTLMSVFFYTRKSEIIDSLIELFVQIVHRLSAKAERRVIKSLVKDFKKIHGKDALLVRIAEAALEYPDETVKDVVYPIAGEQTLANIIKEHKASGKVYNKEVHNVIRSSYGSHYRRMVPKILDNMEFCSNNQAHRPVLDAIEWIRLHKDSKQQYYLLSESISVYGVIRPKWYETTIEVDDKGVERVNSKPH